MPGVFVIASGVVRDAILTELITLKESHRHQKVVVLARDDAEEAALSDAWNTDGCVPTSAWVVSKGAGALSRAWVCTPALVPAPVNLPCCSPFRTPCTPSRCARPSSSIRSRNRLFSNTSALETATHTPPPTPPSPLTPSPSRLATPSNSLHPLHPQPPRLPTLNPSTPQPQPPSTTTVTVVRGDECRDPEGLVSSIILNGADTVAYIPAELDGATVHAETLQFLEALLTAWDSTGKRLLVAGSGLYYGHTGGMDAAEDSPPNAETYLPTSCFSETERAVYVEREQCRRGGGGRARARACVCVCVVYVDMGESGREAQGYRDIYYEVRVCTEERERKKESEMRIRVYSVRMWHDTVYSHVSLVSLSLSLSLAYPGTTHCGGTWYSWTRL